MTRASEWAARVELWRASGQSAPKWCAGRDYSAKSLLWWSSRLRRKGAVAASPQSAVEPVRLARVVRTSTQAPTASAIVVQCGVVRVEVPAGTNRTTLAAVFEALGIVSEAAAR